MSKQLVSEDEGSAKPLILPCLAGLSSPQGKYEFACPNQRRPRRRNGGIGEKPTAEIQKNASAARRGETVIKRGDIFWVELEEPRRSEPGYRHPHVIIQNNLFNQSRIRTVMVCPLTSNLKRASSPGNVLLERKEANLPKQSVVIVSQVFTVDKSQLAEPIGTLSARRIREILDGIKLAIEPREVE
jgi:mRNA interferase MazF